MWVGLWTRNGILAQEAGRTELHLKAGCGEIENKEGAWSLEPEALCGPSSAEVWDLTTKLPAALGGPGSTSQEGPTLSPLEGQSTTGKAAQMSDN